VDDERMCAKASGEEAIAACTRLIQLDPKYDSYVNRGLALRAKGDDDRAIADFNDAMRLNPKFAAAYINRGIVYQGRGEHERAIADFNEVIKLIPKFAATHEHRGFAYAAKGNLKHAVADYDGAIRLDPKEHRTYYYRGVLHLYNGSAIPQVLADLNQASKLNPKNAYVGLWLDIVAKQSNRASQLPQAIAQLDMTEWPAPLIHLYLGRMTVEAAMAAADDADAFKKKEQICEANFFSGKLSLRWQAKDEAVRMFRLAATDCPKDFIEWWAANTELKALGVTP
jgi:lipoprotein NlpI